jgi:hypothetical protein
MNRTNLGVLVGAGMVLLGFFLGWIGLRGFGGGVFVTGWQVLELARTRGAPYFLLYLFPIGAAVAAFAALVDRRLAATLGVVVGGAFVAWGAFELLRVLWHTTFLGLWLTLLGALILLGAGLATRSR